MYVGVGSFLGNLPGPSPPLEGAAFVGFLENQAGGHQVGALTLPDVTVTDWGSSAVLPGLA